MNNKPLGNNLIEDILALLALPENQDLDLVNLIAKRQKEGSTSDKLKTAVEMVNFMDEMPGGFLIYYAEHDEKIIFANKALLRIFQCDSFQEFQKMTGNSFRGIVHPEDLDRVEMSIWEQIAESQYDFDYVEYRIVRKDGSVGWVDDYGHFIKSDSVGGIFYVFIGDSTEKYYRQQMERNALLDAQKLESEKLQNIIDTYDKEKQVINQEHLRRLEVIEGLGLNYDTILYADLDTDKVLPYRLNSRIEKLFDYDQPCEFSEVIREYLNNWVHADDRHHVLTAISPDCIREKLADTKSYYINYRICAENTVQFLELRIVNVGNGENISQIVIGSRRIDDEILQEMKRKRILEDALSRANAAMVAKNTFLSNMSHDMRTPLNAIFGYTTLAKSNLGNQSLAQKYIERIEESGSQLLELIDKVLGIAWTESGDIHLAETKCNLAEIAEEICNPLKAKAAAKNISISLDFSGLAHPDIFGDPDKLRLLIKYLSNNAVEYNKTGGTVSISVKETEKISAEYSAYQIVVQDSGIGISEEFLGRIFEPFEREKNTTHSQVLGVGLGLTIAKSIANRMDGDIEVTSEVGKGSTFTATLRLKKQKNPEHTGENPQDNLYGALPGKRILLVEDNEINREIETEILQGVGFLVETAADGKLAVDKLKSDAPGYFSLVLMDIQMPVMNGYEAALAIRCLENPALSRIPIIALSANAFESDRQRSLESGMNEHLAKPLDMPLLLNTISRIFADAEREQVPAE